MVDARVMPRMSLNHYRFHSVWGFEISPRVAFEALEDLGAYPKWWPEVREARRLDEDRYWVRCRSLLPYDLVFEMSRSRVDADAGILEADMKGDLDGTSRWTIEATGAGIRLIFDEDVVVTKGALRKLALVARPAFAANHSLMMRNGRRGLDAYLAGFDRGRAQERRSRDGS